MALTPKQHRFSILVAEGKSFSDAYRGAYDAENMSDAAIRNEASRLMAHHDIAQMVERLRAEKERAVTISALSDRDRVLDKLRTLLDTHDGGPHVTAQLKAAQLLGQSVGLFKDVQIVEDAPKTPAQIEEAIRQRLAMLEQEDSTQH